MPNTQRLLPRAPETTRRLPAVRELRPETTNPYAEAANQQGLGPFISSLQERLDVPMSEISRLWWKLCPLGEGRVAQVAPAFSQTLRAHRQLLAKLPALQRELKRAPSGERRDAMCWSSMVRPVALDEAAQRAAARRRLPADHHLEAPHRAR